MKQLYVAIMLCLLPSCAGSVAKDDMKRIPLADCVRIKDVNNVDFSSVGKVSLVPIDSQEQLLPSGMSFVGIAGDLLFLYDTDAIVSIDMRTGSIMNRIFRKGNGPEEYNMIISASLDPAKEIIYAYDPAKGRILPYDFSGKYVSDAVPTVSGAVEVMPDGNYAVCYHPYSQETCCYGIYDNDWTLIRQGGVQKSKAKTAILNFDCADVFNDFCCFRKSLEDTVYKVTAKNEYPLLLLDRGDYKMPVADQETLARRNRNADSYIEIGGMKIAGDYLFLQYYYNDKMYRDVWSVDKSELLSRTLISGPDSNYGFPLEIDGKIIYCWVDFVYKDSAFCLLPYWEAVKVFPELSEDANPVLVRIDL